MDDSVKNIYAKNTHKLMKIHSFLVERNKIAVLHTNEETELFMSTGDLKYLFKGSIRVLRNEINYSLILLNQLVNNEYEYADDDEDGFFKKEHCDWIEQELQFQLDYFNLLVSLEIEIDRKYKEITVGNYAIFSLYIKDITKAMKYIKYAIDNNYSNNRKINYKELYLKHSK